MEIRMSVGPQTWLFTSVADRWALERIEAAGKPVAEPFSRNDSFWQGSGAATVYQVLANSTGAVAIQFLAGSNRITYSAQATQRLPTVHVAVEGPETVTCGFRAAQAQAGEHGAWVTRGDLATDRDGRETFIDGSGPMVFGHSTAGDSDTGYLFMPRVKEHLQKNGRTEQKCDAWFKAERQEAGDGRFRGAWQLRMGKGEPKEFDVVFDQNPGGRFSDVCEKYFADAVDSLVDLKSVPRNAFDPEKCLEMIPVRLASPDAFIPGWGWMMDEFPNASYPFAHDAVWQTPALLAFEGLATGRPWERNFARYFLDQTPIEGAEGKSYFVRRPGGLTRWAYFGTYRNGFPRWDGGSWWQADILYRTALALGDAKLRQTATELVLHDLDVKLDLVKMSYPPCWDASANQVGADHRDDWFKTPGLAYCAYMAAKVAYPETGEARYLAMADKICDWFAAFIVPEAKLNELQGNNMHAVFSHYLPLAFLDRFERSHDRRFLDMARDMAWEHILTTCTTAAKDSRGNPLTGTTCVGVRGCVDYDCAPNLCHEKDLTFVHLIGPLLKHVSGPAYAKYVALHRLVLAKDSWTSAWAADLRDTNLRTMYDTYARGMANLVFALNRSSDPWVFATDKLVSASDTNITRARDVALVNGTPEPRETRVQLRFLQPGTYRLTLDGEDLGKRTEAELAAGFSVKLPPNGLRTIQARSERLQPPAKARAARYDASVTWLSEREPYAAQRGTGLPQPTFRQDLGFDGAGLKMAGRGFTRGLGFAANTVLLYDLAEEFQTFHAIVGVDDGVAGQTNPAPSVFFTVFVDGNLRFESGPMLHDTPAKPLEVDVRGARMLMLRMSCNWDDNGKSQNDHGDWAEARLIGRAKN
jgi:hypothetical protein